VEVPVLASLLATGISGFTALLAAFITAYVKKGVSKDKTQEKISELEASPEKDSRLLELKEELKRQESIAKWQGLSATFLTFSQYIIGGVLTTSFIQETLTSGVVGFLGLLVLLSSLIHQHFRPDLHSRFAKERIVVLRNVKRQVEDGIFAIEKEKSRPEELHNIRDYVTRSLLELESSELRDLDKVETDAGF